MKTAASHSLRSRPRRASIIIIVLVSLLMTAGMVMLFIDKASTDLIVESRQTRDNDLRAEAYSALEVTLSVLTNFAAVDGNVLRSPREGWDDPLKFAAWEPSEGRTVDVSFEDESGKIPLPTVTAANMTAIFEEWDISQADAEKLTDALMSWMKTNYAPTSTFTPDYDQGDIPYAPPHRSLLSFDELAAINVASDMFYTEDGLPNDLWIKFSNTFSLYNYPSPSLNALPVRPDILLALGQYDDAAAQKLSDYLTGTGEYEGKGTNYLKNSSQAATILGGGTARNFSLQIYALRVHITVHEGLTAYHLNALVTLPNGAQTVQSSATNNPTAPIPTVSSTGAPITNLGGAAGRGAAGGAAGAGGAARGGAAAGGAAGGARGGAAAGGRGAVTTPGARGGNAGGATGVNGSTSINYPFTVLEIRENNENVAPSEPATPTPDE